MIWSVGVVSFETGRKQFPHRSGLEYQRPETSERLVHLFRAPGGSLLRGTLQQLLFIFSAVVVFVAENFYCNFCIIVSQQYLFVLISLLVCEHFYLRSPPPQKKKDNIHFLFNYELCPNYVLCFNYLIIKRKHHKNT